MNCPNCGTELVEGSEFCVNCGAKFTNGGENLFCDRCDVKLDKAPVSNMPNYTYKKSKNKKGLVITIVSILVLLIIGIVIAIIAFNNNGKSKYDFEEIEKYRLKNKDTNYELYIKDDAKLLNDDEKTKLKEEMIPLTEYGNIIFITLNKNSTSTDVYTRSYYHSEYGSDSGTVLVIDMDNRNLYLFSEGSNYDVITSKRVENILDDVHQLATDEKYYECALNTFGQILTLLKNYSNNNQNTYIQNSRKDAYIELAVAYIDAVRNKVNEAAKFRFYSTDTLYLVPVGHDSSKSCMSLEHGGQSPYSDTWNYAYVGVTYNGEGYNYFFIGEDGSNVGIPFLSRRDLVEYGTDCIYSSTSDNSYIKGEIEKFRDTLIEVYNSKPNSSTGIAYDHVNTPANTEQFAKLSNESGRTLIQFIYNVSCSNTGISGLRKTD